MTEFQNPNAGESHNSPPLHSQAQQQNQQGFQQRREQGREQGREQLWRQHGAELFSNIHDMVLAATEAWDWRLTALIWQGQIGNPPEEVNVSIPPESDMATDIIQRSSLLDPTGSPLAPQIYWVAYSESTFSGQANPELDELAHEELVHEDLTHEELVQDTWAMELTLLLPSESDGKAALWGELAGPHDTLVTCEDHDCDPRTCECPHHLLWRSATYEIGTQESKTLDNNELTHRKNFQNTRSHQSYQSALFSLFSQFAKYAQESYPESSFRPRQL